MSMSTAQHSKANLPLRPLVLAWAEKRPITDGMPEHLVFSETTGGLLTQDMAAREKFEGTNNSGADTTWTF